MRHRLAALRAAALVSLAAIGAVLPAAAQTGAWPERAIRVVLPFPPGGPSDIVMRQAAEKMQVALKQPIVVDNKPGAGGNLGTADVARAAPDGYTWLFGPDSLVTVNPHVYKQMPFKVDDLVPVTIATQFNQTLVCNPAVGVKTVAELVAKAKAEKMSYASGGAGVPGHLSMELLQSMAGFQMTHVPYKGPAPATQDVLGNQVPCGLLAGPTVLPHVRAGKLVALAVSGSRRSPTLPDVPTMAEAGVAGYKADFTLVMFAPRAVPEPILARFRQAFVDALSAPDLVEKLKAGDQTVVGSTPADAAATLAADSKKWGAVARRIQLGTRLKWGAVAPHSARARLNLRRHARQGAPGLEQRLQVREHLRPAAGDAGEHLRILLQVLVRDGEANQAVALRLDVDGDARMLGLVAGIGGPGPGVDQAARRRAFDHLADDVDRARAVGALVLPARAGLPVGDIDPSALRARADPVLGHHVGVDERLPHLLRRGRDVGHVYEARLCRHRLFLPVFS